MSDEKQWTRAGQYLQVAGKLVVYLPYVGEAGNPNNTATFDRLMAQANELAVLAPLAVALAEAIRAHRDAFRTDASFNNCGGPNHPPLLDALAAYEAAMPKAEPPENVHSDRLAQLAKSTTKSLRKATRRCEEMVQVIEQVTKGATQ